MRGKGEKETRSFKAAGITPAYAGKSRGVISGNGLIPDHPRLCGEKCTQFRRFLEKRGSPPPMRGKGYTTAAESEENRITPAYAGKSVVLNHGTFI